MNYLLVIIVALIQLLFCRVDIITSTTDLADIAKTIGGERVKVTNIARGNQDPHYVEILPSYMIKVKKADIYLKVGMELDMWASLVIAGSRNKNLIIVDCSKNIQPLETPTGKIDASMGDIHSKGNPHYWLDPENGKIITDTIFEALVKFDPQGYEYYQTRHDDFIGEINKSVAKWHKDYSSIVDSKVIFYHNSWPYFSSRFGLNVIEFIEPIPGIMPTPNHLKKLLEIINSNDVQVIAMEPYFSDVAPKYLKEITGIQTVIIAQSVGAVPEADSYLNMIEYNLDVISKALDN